MEAPVFRSKSSNREVRVRTKPDLEVERTREIPTGKKKIISFLGCDKDFLLIGDAFDYEMIDLIGGALSVIPISEAVILYDTELRGKALTILNMATEYGIPVMWYGEEKPVSFPWSFKTTITERLGNLALWEKLYQMMQ